MNIEKVFIYTDGGSRGNPGPGAIGILIIDCEGKVIYKHGEYIGNTTNNQAEYKALIKALKNASNYTQKNVLCFSDSELMIKQLNGDYKVRNPDIKELFLQIKEIEKKFEKVTYKHVKRENENIFMVDQLVNNSLDDANK